jgi:hypothetical protein
MPKSNPIELFVLHSLPERKKETFRSFRPAYKEFVKRAKNDTGSVALWRGPQWTRLYASDRYPPALSQPYPNADV